VRLRLAVTDNAGPLRAGVDDIRFEPIDRDANARIELPRTEQPANALNLVLHRMTEADALRALSARAETLAGEDDFSGAVLAAKDGRVSSATPTDWPTATDGSRTRCARAFASGR
jgi:hypothetical protein